MILIVVLAFLAYIFIDTKLSSFDLLETGNKSHYISVDGDFYLDTNKHNKYEIFVPDVSYHVVPGKTFYADKGDLKLYATIEHDGDSIVVHGEEFHEDGQLIDGTIDEIFNFNSDIDCYQNEDKTIFIYELSGNKFRIVDNRPDVCLPFNGVLELLEKW